MRIATRTSMRVLVALALALVAGAFLVAPARAFAAPSSSAIDLYYDYHDGSVNGVSDPTTNLTVSKLDPQTHDAVVGATLAILDRETGEEKVRWVTTADSMTFDRYLNREEDKALNVETEYILRELKAPEGYEKADDVVFRIEQYGEVTILEGGGENAESPNRNTINLYDVKLQAVRDVVRYETDQVQALPHTGRDNASTQNATTPLSQTGDMIALGAIVAIVLLAVAALILATRHLRNFQKDETE